MKNERITFENSCVEISFMNEHEEDGSMAIKVSIDNCDGYGNFSSGEITLSIPNIEDLVDFIFENFDI